MTAEDRLQENLARFVQRFGHLLLLKIDPEAAIARNLMAAAYSNEGMGHAPPDHPRSSNTLTHGGARGAR